MLFRNKILSSLLLLGALAALATPVSAYRGEKERPHARPEGRRGPDRLLARLSEKLALSDTQTQELARYAEQNLEPVVREGMKLRRELRRKILAEGESAAVKALKKEVDALHERGYQAQLAFSNKLNGMLDEDQKARLKAFSERSERDEEGNPEE